MEARDRLLELARAAETDTLQTMEWLQAGTYEPIIIANALQNTLDRFESINTRTMAEDWVAAIDNTARERLNDRIRNTLGVPTVYIFDDENVRYAASLMSSTTASLIKDVPREYIQNVTQAAIQAYQGIPFPEDRTLTQQIMHLNSMTRERARTIARHQTSVINAAVNQARQTAVGIEEFFWSTANDTRVVGNPAGIYPNGTRAHGRHWERDYRWAKGDDGQPRRYRWNALPEDGAPGVAPGCRCVALPILETEKMNFERIMVSYAA